MSGVETQADYGSAVFRHLFERVVERCITAGLVGLLGFTEP